MVDGSKVRRWRLTRALSQRALAEKSGVTFDAISQIEQGSRQPQPRTLAKLAVALDVEPPMLLLDGATMSTLIDDGAMLWRMPRPELGWSKEQASDIDDAVFKLAREHGIRHLYLWIARDAWNVVAPHLRHNMLLGAPGVQFDVGPRGTQTEYSFVLYKADPDARRPAYMESLLRAQGLVTDVPQNDVGTELGVETDSGTASPHKNR
jgi:transcriptional regulator with XRE-family HTH domain